MTIRDDIAALPWFHQTAVNNYLDDWDRDNRLTRFLQGAGNKEKLEAFIADLTGQGVVIAPTQPVPVEETPEVPETPAEDSEPPAAGEGE
jgi:hypothetical protein